MGSNDILLAHALLRLQHRDFVVASVAFHPSPILQGSLGQDLRRNRILTMHIPEEVNNMLRPRQQRQVALDDDAVETVIYKNQEAFKELREDFHRSPPLMFGWIPKSSARATGGINQLHRWDSALPLLGISRAQPLAITSSAPAEPLQRNHERHAAPDRHDCERHPLGAQAGPLQDDGPQRVVQRCQGKSLDQRLHHWGKRS